MAPENSRKTPQHHTSFKSRLLPFTTSPRLQHHRLLQNHGTRPLFSASLPPMNTARSPFTTTHGKVFVDGKVVNKSGTPISDKAVVEIKAEVPKYVCRAGHKLEAAIEQLEIDVTGKVALDSGLSTGGFADFLLQYGASFVYSVDVGYGQVADKIRRHDCVTVIERTNLRYLSELPQKVDLVTLDLSFISILTVYVARKKAYSDEEINGVHEQWANFLD